MTEVAVYRLRDSRGRLLYIGQTSDLDKRLHDWARGHCNRDWWPDVVEPVEDVTWYPDRAAAKAAEREAIQTEHPLHNHTHRAEPPEDWEWADYEPPVNEELIAIMRNHRWGSTA